MSIGDWIAVYRLDLSLVVFVGCIAFIWCIGPGLTWWIKRGEE